MNNCGSSALTATNYTGSLLWSTNANTPFITVTASGTYTVTQTVNGCTSATGSGTAAPKTPPAAPPVTVANYCGYSTLSTTAKGGLKWSTGDTTQSIKVYNSATHTVTQTVNGCTSQPGSGTAAPAAAATLTVKDINANTGATSCSASVAFGAGINVTATGSPTLVYKIGSKVITSPYNFPQGSTTVTVTATNSCSCVSKSFVVTVTDKTAPAMTCRPGATKTVSCGYYTVSGKEFDATATDNCTLSTLAYSVSGATNISYASCNTTLAGKRLNVGANTITWTATDAAGNKSSCTTVVTVKKSSNANFIAGSKLSSLKTEAKLSIKMSPVPARSTLTVLVNGFTGKTLMQVFNSEGKQVRQQNWTVASPGSWQQAIDVSTLAGGSYLLRVSDKAGNQKTKKFIVSR